MNGEFVQGFVLIEPIMCWHCLHKILPGDNVWYRPSTSLEMFEYLCDECHEKEKSIH